MTVFWQASADWRHDILGTGHAGVTIGAEGCVESTLAEAVRLLTPRKMITPKIVNDELKLVPGAFVDSDTGKAPGHSLVLDVACKHYGLDAPIDERVVGVPGHPSLADALDKKLVAGTAAFVRVALGPDGIGKHTILAVGRRARDGALDCLCTALAQHVYLPWPSLSLPLSWGKDAAGKPINVTYRVVGVRPVRPVAV